MYCCWQDVALFGGGNVINFEGNALPPALDTG